MIEAIARIAVTVGVLAIIGIILYRRLKKAPRRD